MNLFRVSMTLNITVHNNYLEKGSMATIASMWPATAKLYSIQYLQ